MRRGKSTTPWSAHATNPRPKARRSKSAKDGISSGSARTGLRADSASAAIAASASNPAPPYSTPN
jgi:hypothetical protein